MQPLLTGIHHVTALAKDSIQNHDFYTRVLGQRMVKKTVNFDDPLTYHLYFGDEAGSPGTLLTHFPHPMSKTGVHGSPEILETVLSVPAGSLPYWIDRFNASGVKYRDDSRATEQRVAFEDPHGMLFALIESSCPSSEKGYAGADVLSDHAITGIEGVVIHVPVIAQTAGFLSAVLGFSVHESRQGRTRMHLGLGRAGERLELVESPSDQRTSMGAGTVHHVAWRVPDDESQAEAADRLRAAGVAVTPVTDRQYFKSIYFRIPGGVIFEIATDGPGFDIDEPVSTLGQQLKLPQQYESRRTEIERHLVPIGPAHESDKP